MRLRASAPTGALAAAILWAAPLTAQEADLDGVAYDVGDPDAPVVVVEYGDFACDACGEFARESWPALKRDFVDTGRVRWRFVLFELGFPNSDESARAGHCGALLGDFFELHDALYRMQAAWNVGRHPDDRLIEIAGEHGYEPMTFRACYEDNPGKDRTRAANRAARRDGVRATPTFFINGFRVQGALPADVFAKLIEGAESRR